MAIRVGRVRRSAALAGGLMMVTAGGSAQLSTDWRPSLLANLGGPGRFGQALAVGDFDGDGFDDLAVGEPESVGEDSEPDVGNVRVFYGAARGPDPLRRQVFDQATAGVPGTPVANERFGAAVATGRFDDDDYDDLAIGVPSDRDVDDEAAGGVVVLYGGPGGLGTAGAQLWSQASAGVPGEAEPGDLFGAVLASGDFDDDGDDDLAIGVPGENRDPDPPFFAEGAVNVLYAGASGLSATGSQVWTGVTFGSTGFLGAALVAAPLDDDDYADLAVAGPAAGAVFRGTVFVLHGAAGGLGAAGLETVTGDQDGEAFGASLASGDWNADGHPDLAIGAPSYDLAGDLDVGRVELWFGGGAALIPWQSLTASSAEVPGLAEPGDGLGATLVSCDFDANGHDDLAIGLPREDWDVEVDAGAVVVLYLDAAGLRPVVDNQQIAENDLYPAGSEAGDRFGHALACGDMNGTGQADLSIGVPDQSSPIDDEAGSVWTIFGVLFADGFEGGDTSRWSAVEP